MNAAIYLLLIHAASTIALTGLIWMVQLVHYPSFVYVEASRFVTFSRFHQTSISFVVVPLMLAELVTALALLGYRPAAVPFGLTLAGLFLVALLWLMTFAIQVPLHNRLSLGYDREVILSLVRSNWWRTALWTLRAVLVVHMMYLVTQR